MNLRHAVALHDVENEVERTITLHPPYNSPHEALGIVMGEFEEFKAEVCQ